MKKVSASRGAVDTARAVYLKNYNPGAPPYEPKVSDIVTSPRPKEFDPNAEFDFPRRVNTGACLDPEGNELAAEVPYKKSSGKKKAA